MNRAISAGAATLYGLCHAAIVSAGYSPALGFIHTGKQLSFVYDVADLYKIELLIPTAFRVAAEGTADVEIRVRRALRDRMAEIRLLERAVANLHELFSGPWPDDSEERDPGYDEDAARPGLLWDPSGGVRGGVSYGRNYPGEGSDAPAR